MSGRCWFHASWTVLLVLVLATSERAAADPPPSPRQALEAAWRAAAAAVQRGPTEVTLRDQAKLALPDGFGFVPQKQAADVMHALGNRTDNRFLGLIVPLKDRSTRWLVTVQYEPSGYIKDDDAKHWDAGALLESLKKGTEAGNAERERLGIAPLEVTRWIEAPAYASESHQLVWSAEAKEKNGPDPDPTVNYNTYVLGREGYISLNLITSANAVEGDKAAARQLIASVAFNSGKSYGDFNSSTDKVAAYGLAALVAGVAAKKLGLLALAAAAAVKFAKVIVLAVAGGSAALAKWFKARGNRQSSGT
jgi:uncharacterized membrane-anchored protein